MGHEEWHSPCVPPWILVQGPQLLVVMPTGALEQEGHLWEVPPDPTGSPGEGSSSDSLAALSQTQRTVKALALHPRFHSLPPPVC